MKKSNITNNELVEYLNNYLEIDKYDDIAYNGLQVNNSKNITKIATAVSASLEVIEKAAEIQAQMLICHHGIFCKKDTHPLTGIVYKKIKLLMEHNIALACYHLPLDGHKEIGNNYKAGQELGLKNIQPFGRYSGIPIGIIGEISPISFENFKNNVEKYYERHAEYVQIKDTISRVALISGAAEKKIVEAAQAGADCFITGRTDEQIWDQAHENNISFLSLGHYSTETVGSKALAQHLEKELNITTIFIKTKNPF